MCVKDPFMLKYCPDTYKTREIFDNFLPTLKFVPDVFAFSMKIGKVTFSSYKTDAFSVDPNIINLNDANFWLGIIDLNNAKHFKQK